MSKEEAKELALVTAVILHEDLLYGSIFHVFDHAYKLAGEFVKIYPHDYVWEDKDKDFDETIIEFVNQKLKKEENETESN